MEGQSSYTLSIQAGTSIKIRVPIDLKFGTGFFPSTEDHIYMDGKELRILNGFAVLNEDVGILSKVPNSLKTGDPEIMYQQLKQKENKIYFFSDNRIYQTVDILNIPLHDHSSIVQGGPAFGTYFIDYDQSDVNGGGTN
jgi:hypothetical protein